MDDNPRFTEAIRRFDQANSEDPHTELIEGREQPKELVYAQRMSAWVDKLDPTASECLRLAAHSQHLCRWTLPRSDFPMNREGYYQWRTTLAKIHADKAAEILRDVGYEESAISEVQDLLVKKKLKTNPDTQTLEDAAALVFLENHLLEFSRRADMDEAKLINVLQKTWAKMSERGHQAALALTLPAEVQPIVEKALQ